MTDQERDELLRHCDRLMFVTVTAAHVAAGMSRNGGWSMDQFRLLGFDEWPVAGWKGRVVGRRLPGSDVAAFIRLRDAHLPDETPGLFDLGGEG